MSRSVALVLLAAQMLALLLMAPPATAAPPPFPGLKEIHTLGTADGGVSGLEFTFNGTVDARRAHASFFQLSGCTCLNPRIEENDNYDSQFTLRFQAEQPTSVTPRVRYTGTSPGVAVTDPLRTPEDSKQQWSPAPAFDFIALDLVPPGILDATTQDRDGNGLLDAYRVRFTEAISDDSFVVDQWHVAGTQVGPLAVDGALDDAAVSIPFEERAFLNSGAVPQLSYGVIGANGLRDLAGHNGLQDVAAGRVVEKDGVPARLLRTAAEVGSPEAFAVFSEPVRHVGGGAVQAADFTYSDTTADGAHAVQGATAAIGSAIVHLTLDAPVSSNDLAGDGIAVPAGRLEDAATPPANGVLPGRAVLAVDTTPPGPVQSLNLRDIGTVAATVTWTSPADVDLDHVEVRIVAQGQNTQWTEMALVGNVTGQASAPQSIALSGLTSYRSYEVAVRTMDASRNLGTNVVRATFTTWAAGAPGGTTAGSGGVSGSNAQPVAGAPGPVTGLTYVRLESSAKQSLVVWQPPTALPAAYQVRFSTTTLTNDTFLNGNAPTALPRAAASNEQLLAGGPGIYEILSNLTASTTYSVGVRGLGTTGAVGPPTFLTFTTPTDVTPPPGPFAIGSTTHTSGKASNKTAAAFTWPALKDPDVTPGLTDAPVFYHFSLDQQANRTVSLLDPEVPMALTNKTLNLTVRNLEAGAWFVHVAAFSRGGFLQAPDFKLVVDRAPPGPLSGVHSKAFPARVQFDWTLPADAGAGAKVVLRRVAGTAPSGGQWSSYGNETAFAGNGGNVTALKATTMYAFAARVADEAGNLGPMLLLDPVTTTADTTVPVGGLEVSVVGRTDNVALAPDFTLGWTAARDDETPVTYRYALVSGDGELPSDAVSTVSPHADFTDIVPGRWVFLLRAESAGGLTETTHTVIDVASLSLEDVRAANRGVSLQVKRAGATNELSWTLPQTLVTPVGIQLWAGNSPYQMVQDISAPTPQGTFVHDGATAKESTRYVVTLYFAKDAQHGWYEDGAAPLAADYPGVAGAGAAGFDWIRWGELGAGVLVLAGLAFGGWIVVQRLRSRRLLDSGDDEPADADSMSEETATWRPDDAPADGATAPWDSTAPAESRDVACFQCSTVYSAVGALPLETVCPSCGARGMLA